MLALIDINDAEVKTDIMKIMISEVKLNVLATRLTDIFIHKIGGTKKKLKYY